MSEQAAQHEAAVVASTPGAFQGWKGRTLGGYSIVEHLDSGGMAEIFLARYERPGNFRKEVVLKLLQSRYAGHPQVIAMFRDEARIGARLDHPVIVEVFDTGEEDGQPFIVMEYIKGRTLTELIRRGLEVSRPLPLSLAVALCERVADGLAYLDQGVDRQGRRLGVVHRDISPTNILVDDRGYTKIIDFGVATDQGDSKEEAEARPGKYSYMSPEQVKGEKLDGRSDIFSLGIMLYEITLGRRLFRGKPQEVMERIVSDRVRPPTFIDRKYPPALEAIVMRALERSPADRYPTAEALARDLDRFLADRGERVSERRLAEYIATIEKADVAVSDRGARRAAAFVLEDEDVDDEEALDLDRGAAQWGVFGPDPDEEPDAGAAPLPAALSAAPVGDSMAAASGAAQPSAAPGPSPGRPSRSAGALFLALLLGIGVGALTTWLLLR